MEKLEVEYPIFLLEKQKIIALNDKVIVEYKSATREYRVEYEYSDLKPRMIQVRDGNPGRTNLGNNLLFIAFMIAISSVFIFRSFFESPYYELVVLWLGGLGLVAHCLRLMKYDQVWFYEKDGSFGFVIKLTKHNREEAEKVISYITEKLSQVESKTTQK